MIPLPAAWVARFDDELVRWDACRAAWRSLEVGRLRVENDHSDVEYDEQVLMGILIAAQRSAGLIAEVLDRDREGPPGSVDDYSYAGPSGDGVLVPRPPGFAQLSAEDWDGQEPTP